ncbi:MAG: HD domain-containing protein [Magnetococcales bacterium]|nr:HD domain-containing protein [Magnetococcales bacterium]
MGFDLFEDEHAVLEHSKKILKKEDASPQELRDGLENLLEGYQALFKGNKRMMRVSDRNEKKLKDAHSRIQSHQDELAKVHQALELHAETLEERVVERTAALALSQRKLEKLVELGIGLTAETNTDRLMERILAGGREIANAARATLFIRTEDDFLTFAYRSDSDKLPDTRLPLYDQQTGEPIHHFVSTHVALTGETVHLDDVYGDTGNFDLVGTRQFDAASGYRTESMLTVALQSRHGESLGVLQLLNALDPESGEVTVFDSELIGFVEALASQGAMALDNLKLMKDQEKLFEAIIQVLASAIDAKSPYTGGHCERVPELGKLLAQSICDIDEGPFADFSMTEDEWKAFYLAGWLHDCGKVTTPEYVVDKATKLETIYNRIHEIRMRFEVLRRDAEIEYLKEIAKRPSERDALEQQRDERFAELEEEFAFVATSNQGGEFMDPSRIERLNQIANRSWLRHFDDRLGLSIAELKRLDGIAPAPLPAVEKLIADKPQHVIPRSESPLSYKPWEWGFKVEIPKNLYDYGEMRNLSISRGTLTEEERFKINEHTIQTIIMLGQLPFPHILSGVAEMAGSHHETMMGSGYPKKLNREDMSVQARILAIADIFEALTAADRPYKPPKTLSQSLKIMGFMRNDGHIDPDLFDLFLRSGAWQEYAERYLKPQQIDSVDIEQFLSKPKRP